VDGLQANDGVQLAPVVSSDLFYDDRDELQAGWARAGVAAVEMECATLFALAAKREVAAAALLIVSDRVFPTRARIDAEALRVAEHRAGELALIAFGVPVRPGAGRAEISAEPGAGRAGAQG
jgi:purine-nucleoside phosphorylase